MARISARETLKSEGVNVTDGLKVLDCPKAMEALGEMVTDSTCPACCDEGCVVEPDGECEHGCPSVLIALGLM